MNRYHKVKRQISERKFSRIFDNNLHAAGTAMIYKNHNQGWVNSLMAVKVGSIIYAKFPCSNLKNGRIDTYAIRYSEEFPLDSICFREYPSKLISKAVEF